MRVGVTGHMDISPETEPLIYREITRILSQSQDPAGTTGISCIARGADSVFARAVLDIGGRLEIVLPSRNYRERKVKPDHAPLFDELLSRATDVRVMDFDDVGTAAYEAANNAVLDSCDRLVAIWDGNLGIRSGTGSVVAQARKAGKPIDIVWPHGAARILSE